MNIFQFLKNKYDKYKVQKLINKPIQEKNQQTNNEVNALSKAFHNIGIPNYIGKEYDIHIYVFDKEIVLDCKTELLNNKKSLYLDTMVLGEEIFKGQINVDIIRKFRSFLDESIYPELFNCNELSHGLTHDDLYRNWGEGERFSDLLRFRLEYQKELKTLSLITHMKTKSYYFDSNASIKMYYHLKKDNIKLKMSIANQEYIYGAPNGKSYSIDIDSSSTDIMKNDVAIKILPFILNEKGYEILGIEKPEDFTSEVFENYKLLTY